VKLFVLKILVLMLVAGTVVNCQRAVQRSSSASDVVFSADVKHLLRIAERSVVGVGASYSYRVEVLETDSERATRNDKPLAAYDTTIEV